MSGAELALAQPWSKGLQAGDGRRIGTAWCLALQRMFIEQGDLVVHFEHVVHLRTRDLLN